MEALRYLVHFYSNDEFLFQTVTMQKSTERDKTLDSIVSTRSWYWGRYSVTERTGYMNRRLAVEEMLFTEFQDKYWELECRHPVYLYLIPNMSLERIDLELRNRQNHEERGTKYLLFDLERISARSDITFTVDDSMRSYRKKVLAQGIAYQNPSSEFCELEDHGRIFHIDELADVYERNITVPQLRFEVQVWDRDILFGYLAGQESEESVRIATILRSRSAPSSSS